MKNDVKESLQSQPEAIVKVNNISKLYGKHNWAVKNASLTISNKECISLLGSNGSGKTTLMQLIANNVKPTLGEITYSFEEEELTKAINFQSQQQDWSTGFIVKDITALWIAAYDVIDQEWINHLKDIFGVNEIWKSYLSKQSIVKKQLFAFFLIFLYKPELVLIDNLSSDIDWKYSEKISKFLAEYTKKGNTVILNSPSPYFLERLSTRIIYVNNGEIIDDLNKAKIKRDYKTLMNYSRALFKEETIKERSLNNKRKVFAPIVTKLSSYILQLQEAIKVYINYEKTDLSKLEEEVTNSVFNLGNLKWTISEFYKQEINKQTIKNAIKIIKDTKKNLLKTRKHVRNNDSILGQRVIKVLKIIIKYLEGDLTAIFANEKTLYQQSDNQNALSLKERQQLKHLKRKYVKEELKHLKASARREKVKKSLGIKKSVGKS